MAKLKGHIKGDKVKWIIALVVAIGLLAGIVALAVKLDRQTSTTTIGSESYSVGLIDAAGKDKDGDTAIYLRNAVTVDGLKCELEKDAKITYQLFFYDEDGKFLSATEQLTADFDVDTVPEGADTVRIMITPTEDDDGVSFFETAGYANQLKVTVSR